jgi:hypothetical protein
LVLIFNNWVVDWSWVWSRIIEGKLVTLKKFSYCPVNGEGICEDYWLIGWFWRSIECFSMSFVSTYLGWGIWRTLEVCRGISNGLCFLGGIHSSYYYKLLFFQEMLPPPDDILLTPYPWIYRGKLYLLPFKSILSSYSSSIFAFSLIGIIFYYPGKRYA